MTERAARSDSRTSEQSPANPITHERRRIEGQGTIASSGEERIDVVELLRPDLQELMGVYLTSDRPPEPEPPRYAPANQGG